MSFKTMRRKTNSSAGRRSSTTRRRSENLPFDEFGFALTKRKDQKLHHRCHDYSFTQLNPVRVKELCELLSYWNGASFICKSQIERFIRMGIPPSLRGRVWKCLLAIDSLRDTSDFSYQKCLLEVRVPLVDLGVSEYGILSAIATLSETQNHLGLDLGEGSGTPLLRCSADDITVFRQIALDLQRSFPTHRSLMGDSPEAIEGQAKLFRVLIAYAKYSPQVGYSQGMSYLAAVLLMQLGEEEAFWALTALLDKPKYLTELFDFNLTRVQHQVKVFDQFLKHRKPQLSQHLESVGVSSVHFVTPWFLTLFTSLPCWDSVLAVWDLIILHGLSAVFRTALTLVELLEPRLMDLTDEGAVLPLLLRVPFDVSKYAVFIPALWNTEVQDWELKCMSSLVLDESHHEGGEPSQDQKATLSTQASGDKENVQEGEKTSENESASGAKSVLTRVMRLAQRYLSDQRGRQRTEAQGAQTQARSRQRSPAATRVFRSRTGSSLTQSQIRSRRQSQHRGVAQQPVVQGNSDDVAVPDAARRSDSSEPTLKRTSTGPLGKAAGRRSNHSLVSGKSVRLLQSSKKRRSQTPPPTSVLPPSLRAPTLPPSSSNDTPRTALIKELSSRHQTSFPFRNARESKLI
ncbi:uncharacterized protein ACO6RY_10958 [Pungitius sinensis]